MILRKKMIILKYLCIGHSTYDTTLPIEKFIIENNKYRIKQHIECGGGPASNSSYLLAKWGCDVSLASIVGDDYYGNKIKNELENIGVNCKYLDIVKNHDTSSSYIIASKETGSRTIITYKDEIITKISKNIKDKFDVILVDGEHYETVIDVFNNNKDSIKIIDADKVTETNKKLGKMVDYLVCSKKFAEGFSNVLIDPNNIKSLIEVYDILYNYFKNKIIITLESFGSFTKIDNEYKLIPSYKVKAVDSTGAGDIFHGAFTYFISNGYSLEKAIKLSNKTASISVTRLGARYSIPEINEVINND